MLEEIQQCLNAGNLKKAAEIIKSALYAGKDLGGMHVTFAHILLLSADWGEINALLPQGTNFFQTSGWLASLGTNRPVNSEYKPIPWFTYPSIEFIESILQKDWLVFEWGSGNSTLWWAERVKNIISVEDNEAWFWEVKRQLPKNAEIYLKSGKEYVESILRYPDHEFDVIIVDGSARNEATTHCISKLKTSGIIIFDNADSKEFDPAQVALYESGFFRIDFWGLIPSYLYKNCTSIYFRDPHILKNRELPSRHQSSIGLSCFQAIERLQNKG